MGVISVTPVLCTATVYQMETGSSWLQCNKITVKSSLPNEVLYLHKAMMRWRMLALR
jgi:hypothetical protein